MSNLQVVTDRRWMVEELSTNTRLGVKASHGLEVPAHDPSDAWWIPQGVATRFQLSGVAWRLQAPGPHWLSELPLKYAGRDIETLSFEQLRRRNPDQIAFVKFAEAKSDRMEAAVRPLGEAVAVLEQHRTPKNALLQLSEVLDLDSEWRFFISANKVQAASHYLTRTGDGELTYYDDPQARAKGFQQAHTLAQEVAARVDGPSGYVLDVGLTLEGSALVIEANPAWCAAWYGCEIDTVVDTIIAACQPSARWAWNPDPSMLERYARAVRLPWRQGTSG